MRSLLPRPIWVALFFLCVYAVTLYADTISVVPTALGTVADQWSNVGGVNKVDSVDDPIGADDGDTSYIEEDTGSQNQWFARPTLTFSSSAIASVSVKAFCKEIVAAEVQGRIRVNGTNYSGTSTGVPSSVTYNEMTWAWATNPNTAAAWVEADVKGSGAAPLTEFGLQANSVGVGDEVRCTQVFIYVDYTAAVAGTGRMLLLGVGGDR